MAKKSKKSKKKDAKKSSKKKGSKKSNRNFATIGQYLVAKNGKTKYIKISASPKADKEVKKLVKKLIALLGTDALYINFFDADFRDKYDIPDFKKGTISVDLDAEMEDEDEDDSDDDEDDDEDDSGDEESDDDDEDEDDSDDDEDDDEDLEF